MIRYFFILALCIPCFAQNHERVIDVPYLAWNAVSFGSAMADVALTQRCIKMDRCHEANPLMAGSAGRQYAISLGIAGAGAFISYKMKQHNSRAWYLVPMVNTAGHGAGIGLGLRF